MNKISDISIDEQLSMFLLGEDVFQYRHPNNVAMCTNYKFLKHLEGIYDVDFLIQKSKEIIITRNSLINLSAMMWLSSLDMKNGDYNFKNIIASGILKYEENMYDKQEHEIYTFSTHDKLDFQECMLDYSFYILNNERLYKERSRVLDANVFGGALGTLRETCLALSIKGDKKIKESFLKKTQSLIINTNYSTEIINNFSYDLRNFTYLSNIESELDEPKLSKYLQDKFIGIFIMSCQNDRLDFNNLDNMLINIVKKNPSSFDANFYLRFNERISNDLLSSYYIDFNKMFSLFEKLDTSLKEDKAKHIKLHPKALLSIVNSNSNKFLKSFDEVVQKYSPEQKEETVSLLLASVVLNVGKELNKNSAVIAMLSNPNLKEALLSSTKASIDLAHIAPYIDNNYKSISNNISSKYHIVIFNFLSKNLQPNHDVFGALYCVANAFGADNNFDFDTKNMILPNKGQWKYTCKQAWESKYTSNFIAIANSLLSKIEITKKLGGIKKTKADTIKARKI